MVGRVIEIANDARHLSVDRGFLVISEGREQLGRLPLDDIAALVGNAHGLSCSANLVLRLVERGIPFVICGPNHMPAAIMWPTHSHHMQTGRMQDQISASLPLKKRLWGQIVRAKITAQAATLETAGAEHGAFRLLARKVRVGDPDNVEAQAARRYWPLLFGKAFRRDRQGGGLNSLLNYGYAVLRAGVARAVMAAGLHPGFGLMHANRSNPMVLVDDLMEPFRPVVDLEVWRLTQAGICEVDKEAKAALARIMVIDLPTREGMSPLMLCAERLAGSLAAAYAGEDDRLQLPLPHLPLGG